MKLILSAAMLRRAFLFPFFFFCCFYLSAQSCYLTGPAQVCAGQLAVYDLHFSSNQSYSVVWSAPPTLGTIMQQNSMMATIQWEAPGNATILARILNSTGGIITSCSLAVAILEQPHPQITPAFLPSGTCKIIKGDKSQSFNAEGYCENSDVTFSADANSGSYAWSVSGNATITGSNSGSSVAVHTGTLGQFDLTLTEQNAAGCTGTKTVHYEIFGNPTATFTEFSHGSSMAFSVCKGEELMFLGTANDPNGFLIDVWHWDVRLTGSSTILGSGGSQNFNYTFNNPGTYTVSLHVNNCLGCSSVPVTAQVTVVTGVKPDIVCPSVVCQSAQPVQYCAVQTCGDYTWSVQGGTLQGNGSGQCANVVWDQMPTGGYGAVTLVASNCQGNVCNLPTTVEVPVIPSIQPISGPTTLCSANGNTTYSVPFWPGATYTWTITKAPGTTGSISPLSYSSGNTLDIIWSSLSGSFTVSVHIQHPVSGCISDGQLAVQVLSYHIVGVTKLCYGNPAQLSIAPAISGSSYSVNWSIFGTSYSQTVVNQSNVTIPFSAFGNSGQYLVIATVKFDNGTTIICDQLSTAVTYLPKVPDVNEVIGPRNVCPNQTYMYTASPTSPTQLIWTITGGTPATATGASVNIHWGAGPNYHITVKRQDINGCMSMPLDVNDITSAGGGMVNSDFTGDFDVCSDGTAHYDAVNLNADSYTWTISPPQSGTILSGQGTPHIMVVWNSSGQGNTQTTHVKLEIKQCGGGSTTTKNVLVHPGAVHIFCPTPDGGPCKVCQNSQITFSMEALPGNGYVWTVDNQVIPGMNTNHFNYSFPTAGTHYVGVTYANNGAVLCPGPYSDAITVDVIPNPDPIITSPDFLYCDDPKPITLFATSYAGANSEIFYWFTPHGLPATPGNDPQLYLPITANDLVNYLGNYQVVINREIDGLTCVAVANYEVKCLPKEDMPNGSSTGVHFDDWHYRLNNNCTSCPPNSDMNECGHVTVHGSIGSHSFIEVEWAQWVVFDPSNGLTPNDVFPINSNLDLQSTEIFTFTNAGFYPAQLQVKFLGDGNVYIDPRVIEVPLVPDFTVSIECCSDPATTGSYRLKLRDISSLAGNNIISDRKWTFTVNNDPPYTLSASDPLFLTDCIFKANDVVTVCLQPFTTTVGSDQPGLEYYCTRCQIVNIPSVGGTVSISASRPLTCENTPVQFTSSVTGSGVVSYTWDFGDYSYSNLANPIKTFIGPGPHLVTLTVKFSNGCTASASITVVVESNDLNGSIQSISDPCGNTIGLEFQPAVMNNCALTYLWAPDHQTTQCIQIPGSGVYMLTVTDCRGCRKILQQEVVTQQPFVDAIGGATSVCQKDQITFSITPQTGFTYHWSSDYPGFVANTGSSTTFSATTSGDYHVTVTANHNGTDCGMLMQSFSVHPLPALPTYDISYNCDPFYAHITTDPIQLVDFFRNGQYLGNLAEYYSYESGNFNLIAVTPFGCKSKATFQVADPINVDILSGCYTLCASDLHDCNRKIPAPPGTYTDWQWIQTDPAPPVTLASGHNSPVTDLCLLPTMAGKISLHVQNNYTSSNYDPATGTTTNSTISCSAVSDPFCLTVTSCFVCPPLTVSWMSTLSGGGTPVLCGPYAEHVYHVQGNMGIPAGYNTCNNHPTLNGGYFDFTLFVVNPLNGNIQFDGFLHVTDIATFESVGLTGTFNLCNNTNGIVCPATLHVPPIMCMPGMNFNCDPLTTETVRGPFVTNGTESNVSVKYCFNLHYVTGTPCSITQYTVDINTTAGVNLAHKVFTGIPPSDLYQCVEFTINSSRWASLHNCVNINIQSNCLEMGCSISNFCGSGPYGGAAEPGMDRSDLSSDGKSPYLKLTPNPVQNDLSVSYLSLTQTEDVQIMVFNSMGQLVSRLTDQPASGEVRLDVRDWTPGIYFVALHTSEGLVQNAKVVVQH
jgi:PKD repeat protein